MNEFVLVVLFMFSGNAYTGVEMQEFIGKAQCEYAAKIIKQRGHVVDAFCLNKRGV